jgi:hypothetical protein
METEQFEKRFGVLAIEKKFITPEQLIEAIKIQVLEDIQKGKHRLIGRILLESGQLTVFQIDEVIQSLGTDRQGKRAPFHKIRLVWQTHSYVPLSISSKSEHSSLITIVPSSMVKKRSILCFFLFQWPMRHQISHSPNLGLLIFTQRQLIQSRQ